jgi:hypothetical protein
MDCLALKLVIVTVYYIGRPHLIDHFTWKPIAFAVADPICLGVQLVIGIYVGEKVPEKPLTKCSRFIFSISSLLT